MTDSTLEKMAEAAWVSVTFDRPPTPETIAEMKEDGAWWPHVSQHVGAAGFREAARAALEAIRDEPDRRVLNAGAFYHIDHAGGAGEHEMSMARQSWRAMVKAILNEKA